GLGPNPWDLRSSSDTVSTSRRILQTVEAQGQSFRHPRLPVPIVLPFTHRPPGVRPGSDSRTAPRLDRARRPVAIRRDSRVAPGPLFWNSTVCRDILGETELNATTRTFELWEHWVNSNAASWTPSGSMTTGCARPNCARFS